MGTHRVSGRVAAKLAWNLCALSIVLFAASLVFDLVANGSGVRGELAAPRSLPVLNVCVTAVLAFAPGALASFSARLRGDLDLETLRAEIGAVFGETMRPTHVSLWLRDAAALTVGASRNDPETIVS